MLENDPEPHICFECDSEFIVHTPYQDDQTISFCPFCGSEMETDLDEEFDDEDDEDQF